jgi:type II secretory pathway pseudopilin PulG
MSIFYKFWRSKHLENKGISILEILVVIAIIAVTFTSLLGLASFSLGTASLIKQTTQANMLAQGTMEAVRNFRDQTSWDVDGLGTLLTGTPYYLEKSADNPPKWILIQGEETIDIFKRKVIFNDVMRDANDNIVESGGTNDPDTKKVIVTVSWQERGRNHQVELITYLTNWK